MQVLMWKDSTVYPRAVTKSQGTSVYVCKYWCMCVRVQAHVCVRACVCVLMGGGGGRSHEAHVVWSWEIFRQLLTKTWKWTT